MLRLTLIAETETTATIKVEGAIVAEWGALLTSECLKSLARKPELVLDFSGVTFIDKHSAKMVRNMMQAWAVRLINCWSLIEARIQNDKGDSRV